MSDCPCGSGAALADCCQRYISGEQKPATAEALMRARYTAHTLGAMSYIFDTHHPATRSDIDEAATTRWAKESEWLGLEILATDAGSEDDATGAVEFRA
ncbi:MAG: hypothetical protein CSA54_06345, partial [Gammaproteobacteria bacterium]